MKQPFRKRAKVAAFIYIILVIFLALYLPSSAAKSDNIFCKLPYRLPHILVA